VGQVRHLFTHRDVTAEVFHVDPTAGGQAVGAGDAPTLWAADHRLGDLAVSSFLRKLLDLKRDKLADRP
jgi:adenine-specific DNA glycosylase